MAKKILFCPKCNATYSAEKEVTNPCPHCGGPLFETSLDAELYQSCDAQGKEEYKEKWQTRYYLDQIANSTKQTAFWIRFWSILSLVSAAITVIVLLCTLL